MQACLCVYSSLTLLEYKLPVGRPPELACLVLLTLTTEPPVYSRGSSVGCKYFLTGVSVVQHGGKYIVVAFGRLCICPGPSLEVGHRGPDKPGVCASC